MLYKQHPLWVEDMESIYKTRENWHEFNHATIYITGSNGMLASYLVYYLIWLRENKDIDLCIIINSRNAKKKKELYGSYLKFDWFQVISEDVCKIDYSTERFKKVDYVIHAASFANAKQFGIYPVETILPNVVATSQILSYCHTHKVKGMVYLSSTAIYGMESDRQLLDEQQASILNLNSMGNFYGISKYCGEALCRAYALEYHVKAMAVRIAHSYGPTMDLETDIRVFAEFVKDVIAGRDITIMSDGKASRFFCYISDCISGILTVLLDGEKGESYNLGNPSQKYTISELAETLASLDVAKNIHVRYSKREDETYTPPTCSSESKIDVSKLEALGWKCKIGAREGFERTIKIIKESQYIENNREQKNKKV